MARDRHFLDISRTATDPAKLFSAKRGQAAMGIGLERGIDGRMYVVCKFSEPTTLMAMSLDEAAKFSEILADQVRKAGVPLLVLPPSARSG